MYDGTRPSPAVSPKLTGRVRSTHHGRRGHRSTPTEDEAEKPSLETTLTDSAPIRDDGAKLSDRVAVELGAQIVRAELPEGARLPTEAELGDVYRVSRSVIRDAIRTLSARGLVEVRQGHGMVVAQPSDAPFAEALIILLMRSSLTLGDVSTRESQSRPSSSRSRSSTVPRTTGELYAGSWMTTRRAVARATGRRRRQRTRPSTTPCSSRFTCRRCTSCCARCSRSSCSAPCRRP